MMQIPRDQALRQCSSHSCHECPQVDHPCPRTECRPLIKSLMTPHPELTCTASEVVRQGLRVGVVLVQVKMRASGYGSFLCHDIGAVVLPLVSASSLAERLALVTTRDVSTKPLICVEMRSWFAGLDGQSLTKAKFAALKDLIMYWTMLVVGNVVIIPLGFLVGM